MCYTQISFEIAQKQKNEIIYFSFLENVILISYYFLFFSI